MPSDDLRRVAFVGSYVPRRCGIATFTHDLRTAVAGRIAADCPVVSLDGPGPRPAYPPEVRFTCAADDPAAYRRAAEFLDLAAEKAKGHPHVTTTLASPVVKICLPAHLPSRLPDRSAMRPSRNCVGDPPTGVAGAPFPP